MLEARGAGETLAVRPSFMAHSRSLDNVLSLHSSSSLEGGDFKLVGLSQPLAALVPSSLGQLAMDLGLSGLGQAFF